MALVMRPLRTLSLFAGIGGLELGAEIGAELAGEPGAIEVVAQVEINDYCNAVLARHWPQARRFTDVKQVTAEVLRDHGCAPIDLMVGGFPCTDISNAGRREGITGKQSGLWAEFARLIGELRPRYIVVENVAALLGRGMGRVLGDLSEMGYDASWGTYGASAVGAPHKRERVFIAAFRGVGLMANADRPEWGPVAQGRDVLDGHDGGWQEAPGRSTAPCQDDADRGLANASGHGWDEGRPEPEGDEGRPDAAQRSSAGRIVADANLTEWEARFSNSQGVGEPTTTPPCHGSAGGTVADSGSRWGPQDEVCTGRDSVGDGGARPVGGPAAAAVLRGDVADALGVGQREPQHEAHALAGGGEARPVSLLGGPRSREGVGLADANSILPRHGHDGEAAYVGSTEGGNEGGGNPVCDEDNRNAIGILGRGTARFSDRVDGGSRLSGWQGWPSRPNEVQHDWEPPRLIECQPHRAKRLTALGNSVVPLQVAPVFMALVLAEQERQETECGADVAADDDQ